MIKGIQEHWNKHEELLSDIQTPTPELLEVMQSIFFAGASAAMVVAQDVSRSALTPEQRTAFWQGQIIAVKNFQLQMNKKNK